MKLVFLRKPDAEPRKGIRSYRAAALTSVMSKMVRIMYYSSLGAREGTRELEEITCRWTSWNKGKYGDKFTAVTPSPSSSSSSRNCG